MKVQSPLLAIVTGMEHSGTTFLHNLFLNNVPNVNSAFECGLLLADKSPRNFDKVKPFYDWFSSPLRAGHWGLTEEERVFVLDTDDWNESYSRLIQKCNLFTNNQKYIIDKTPRYVYDLSSLRIKMPKTPIFITIKDIKLSYASFKKRGASFERFENLFVKFLNSVKYALDNKLSNFFFIKHDKLVIDNKNYLNKVNGIMKIESNLKIDTQMRSNFLPLKKDFDLEKEIDYAQSIITSEELLKLNQLNDKLSELQLEFI